MDTSDLSAGDLPAPAGRSWRRHSAEFKARFIELARQPGVSTAAVALANGLNANMLRRWVREAGECVPSDTHKDTAAVSAYLRGHIFTTQPGLHQPVFAGCLHLMRRIDKY
ncbi:transposase [Pseudacidovorax intermedius]|uniref:transposase n=1 Tax=Pseudacidovorax intermedius TaxID=433924 RepID=UPI0018C9AF55|nr:transposase [Pseudacidovorax intermedius]